MKNKQTKKVGYPLIIQFEKNNEPIETEDETEKPPRYFQSDFHMTDVYFTSGFYKLISKVIQKYPNP